MFEALFSTSAPQRKPGRPEESRDGGKERGREGGRKADVLRHLHTKIQRLLTQSGLNLCVNSNFTKWCSV